MIETSLMPALVDTWSPYLTRLVSRVSQSQLESVSENRDPSVESDRVAKVQQSTHYMKFGLSAASVNISLVVFGLIGSNPKGTDREEKVCCSFNMLLRVSHQIIFVSVQQIAKMNYKDLWFNFETIQIKPSARYKTKRPGLQYGLSINAKCLENKARACVFPCLTLLLCEIKSDRTTFGLSHAFTSVMYVDK